MSIKYDKFISVVPTRTRAFVDYLLKNYLVKKVTSCYLLDQKVDSREGIAFLTFIDAIYNYDKEFKGYLTSKGYRDIYRINFSSSKTQDSMEDAFAYYSEFLCPYDDQIMYDSLSIEKIIAHTMRKLYNVANDYSVSPKVFGSKSKLGYFISDLESRVTLIEKESQDKKIESMVGDIDVPIFNYYVTASKILVELKKNYRNFIQLIGTKEEDLVSVSLLLSVLYANEKNNKSEINEGIKNVLNQYQFGFYSVCKSIGISNSNDLIRKINSNDDSFYAHYLKGYYKDYLDLKPTSVFDILRTIIDRKATNSFAVEKILAEFNMSKDIFKDLEQKVKAEIEIQEKNKFVNAVKEFYGNLPNETREYINFTTRLYTKLCSLLKDKDYENEFLTCSDDADTLSLLIADYVFNGPVSEFFKYYGVTLDKILELVGFELNIDEINELDLDQEILINIFKRFVYDGVNRGRSAENIKIENVSLNLCSRTFNKSIILESLFSKLSNGAILDSDFRNQLERHATTVENERKSKLRLELFTDLPYETIKLLESVSSIGEQFLNSKHQFEQNDLQFFSILYTVMIENSDLREYLESLGIDSSGIRNFLGLPQISPKKEGNIDVLCDHYQDFIYKGGNIELKRKEITPVRLVQNIFNKDLNNSYVVVKFLGQYGLTYDSFTDISSSLTSYQVKVELNNKIKIVRQSLEQYEDSARDLFELATKTYSTIMAYMSQNPNYNNEVIKTSKDVEELALLISLYHSDVPTLNFFEKNGLKLSSIYSYTGLPEELFTTLADFEPGVFIDHYKKYADKARSYSYSVNKDLRFVSKLLFDDAANDSMVIETITALTGNTYSILKEEVLSGQEHIIPLTVTDRIKLLDEEEVSTVDISDIRSVIEFGNSLTAHSKYIYDELPKIATSDTQSTAVSTINGLMEKLVVPEPKEEQPKRRGLFKLFRVEEPVEIVEPPRKIDGSTIEEIRSEIDKSIVLLQRELYGYDGIKKYIESYRIKNKEFYEETSKAIEQLEKKLEALSDADGDYAKRLEYNTYLQALRDKKGRFETSNVLMCQELYKVSAMMANHFVTINALEMARSDLLPLIGSELAINIGNQSQANGLKLSNTIVSLFQNVLNRNIEGASSNLELLKSSAIPEDLLSQLENSIGLYLNDVNNTRKLSLEAPSSSEITLTLDGDKAKQYKL